MWNFASKSIMGTFRLRSNNVLKPRKTPPHSSRHETSLTTLREEGLECPICWESFNVVENVPYVLWCGHTICKYCVIGLQRAVVKFPALPFQLPFFVACPWCKLLSLRLVCNGTVKFPSKNYYLLWMVESMDGNRSKSRGDNKQIFSGNRNTNEGCGPSDPVPDERLPNSHNGRHGVIGFFSIGRLHDSIRKSMAFIAHLLAKFPLIVVFCFIALYAIPVSAAVLGLYIFLTFMLAVPSFLVLYLAFPSLDWLIREIAA